MKRFCAVMVTLFSLGLWAAVEPHLEVEAGFGQVRIKNQGTALAEKIREEIETALLVSEAVAPVVNANRTTRLEVPAQELPSLEAAVVVEALIQHLKEVSVPHSAARPGMEEPEEGPFYWPPPGSVSAFEFRTDGSPDWVRILRWVFAVGQIMWFLLALVIGLPAFYFAPRFHEKVNGGLRQEKLGALVWGLGVGAAFMPLLFLLAVSLVGVPLIPLWGSLVFTFTVLGYLHFGWWCAQKLFGLLPGLKKRSPLVQAGTGVGLLSLLAVMAPPTLVLSGLGAIVGTGAVFRQFFRQLFTGRASS